jgi:hypothetical protein
MGCVFHACKYGYSTDQRRGQSGPDATIWSDAKVSGKFIF